MIRWFKKKVTIKTAWIGAITGLFTLVVIFFQTLLMSRQTDILQNQSVLQSNQTQASTRPNLDIRLQLFEKTDSLLIKNKGAYKINNIRIHQLYFALVDGHGWYASIPSNAVYSKDLKPNEDFNLDVVPFLNMYKSRPLADSFTVSSGMEFLVLLVFFEKEFDGKPYLSIHPGMIVRQNESIELWPSSGDVAYAGPLAKSCHYPVELTFEYFKRRPFKTAYEIYNFNYPFGYQSTGCLGDIVWIK